MTAPFQMTQSFVPTQVPGCQLWFDAADENTFTYSSGTSISIWRDKSSNAYSVIQPTASNQPTLTQSAQNRLNGIQFAQGTYLYEAATSMANFTTGSSTSVLIAARNASNNDSWNIINTIWFDIAGLSATQRYHFSFNRDVTDGTTLFTNNALVGQVTSNAVAASANAILGFTASATSATIHTNGSSNSYAGVTLPDATGNTDFIFNDARNNAASANIMIFEMVGYNTQITTAQRQQLEGYLAWKWGMVANLPADHPYKTTQIYSLPPFPSAPRVLSLTGLTTYNPTNIPNCVLWLDGADVSQMFTDTGATSPVLFTGQSVKCWKDKSTQGNNATNNTNPPTVLFNAQNNRSALNFSSQYLNLDASKLPNGSTPFTSICILKTTSTSTQVYFSWGITSAGNGKAPQLYFTNYTLVADLYGSSAISDTTTYNNAFVVHSVVADSKYNAWDNGNLFSTTNVNIALNTGTSFAYIGTGQVNGVLQTGFYVAGQIAEIIVYSRALLTEERQQLEGYLQWKWGIQTTIPSGNPYNVTPPYSTSPFPLVPRIAAVSNKYFNPNSILGSSLWLDAADPSQFGVSGTTVISVTDKSLSPKTITITNTVSYIKGQSIIFTNTSGRLNLSGMPAAPYDILTVATANSVSNIYRTLLRTANTPGTHPILLQINTENLGMWDGTDFRQFGSLTMATNEKALVYATMASDRTIRAAKNGTAPVTSSTPAGNESVITVIGNNISTGEQPWGTLQEIVIYNKTLTFSERQQVEGYLAWKWGLQGSLPASHPYKLFPPSPT